MVARHFFLQEERERCDTPAPFERSCSPEPEEEQRSSSPGLPTAWFPDEDDVEVPPRPGTPTPYHSEDDNADMSGEELFHALLMSIVSRSEFDEGVQDNEMSDYTDDSSSEESSSSSAETAYDSVLDLSLVDRSKTDSDASADASENQDAPEVDSEDDMEDVFEVLSRDLPDVPSASAPDLPATEEDKEPSPPSDSPSPPTSASSSESAASASTAVGSEANVVQGGPPPVFCNAADGLPELSRIRLPFLSEGVSTELKGTRPRVMDDSARGSLFDLHTNVQLVEPAHEVLERQRIWLGIHCGKFVGVGV